MNTKPGKQTYTDRHEVVFAGTAQQDIASILFQKRQNLKKMVERELKITFERVSRDRLSIGRIAFTGPMGSDRDFRDLMALLAANHAPGDNLSQNKMSGAFKKLHAQRQENTLRETFDAVAQTAAKPGHFTPKTGNQSLLMEAIEQNDVTFATGAAGTGKTFLACLQAAQALGNRQVSKIFLTRPAISAGKDLGAMPGDSTQKLAPYMRPLYDELTKVLGRAKMDALIREGVIEIAPVEFMRGRTFERAFVILDEAQNCSPEQMKMALTRLGEGSRMVVTGDPNQVDLRGQDSGLQFALNRLEGVEGIGIIRFSSADVVRSRVVGRIIDALEREVPEQKPEQKVVSFPKPGPR